MHGPRKSPRKQQAVAPSSSSQAPALMEVAGAAGSTRSTQLIRPGPLIAPGRSKATGSSHLLITHPARPPQVWQFQEQQAGKKDQAVATCSPRIQHSMAVAGAAGRSTGLGSSHRLTTHPARPPHSMAVAGAAGKSTGPGSSHRLTTHPARPPHSMAVAGAAGRSIGPGSSHLLTTQPARPPHSMAVAGAAGGRQ